MQVWNLPIPSSEVLSTSRVNLNDALQSLQSSFLGTVNPSGGALVDGLIFVNTTDGKLRAKASGGIFDLGDWGISNLGHLRRDGTIPLTANWNVGGFLLQNLGVPAIGTDAARKTEVDARLARAGDTLNSGALLSYASPAPSLTAAENLTHKGYCDLKALKTGDSFTGRVNITQTIADRALSAVKTNTGGGIAAYIENLGTGETLYVAHGVAVGTAMTIEQLADATALIVTKPNSGPGSGIDVSNFGTGPGLRVIQESLGDGLRIVQNTNNRAVQFTKTVSGSGDVFQVANAGSGLWIATDANGTMGGTGARLPSSGIWTDGTCYKREKTDIQSIDAEDFLSKIKTMSISRYARKAAVGRGLEEHPVVGPFMEELVELFGLPGDGVRPSELASIALAGVKALLRRLEVLEARVP